MKICWEISNLVKIRKYRLLYMHT